MDKSIDTLLLHYETVHKKMEHPMFTKISLALHSTLI